MGKTCTVDPNDYVVTVNSGSVFLTPGDENELKESVYDYGPTSAFYQATADFGSYMSGVYSSEICNNTVQYLNHVILVVGYGTLNGTDYWLCKNSWGASWGDEGFFKIERGVNMCGISTEASHPDGITSVQPTLSVL